jgi:hypothetical protein
MYFLMGFSRLAALCGQLNHFLLDPYTILNLSCTPDITTV